MLLPLFPFPDLPRVPSSVSYTHLDVYKRQVFSTEELVQNWSANLQILMQAARALDPESREFLQRTIRDLFTISLKTVSYTHLLPTKQSLHTLLTN